MGKCGKMGRFYLLRYTPLRSAKNSINGEYYTEQPAGLHSQLTPDVNSGHEYPYAATCFA